MPSLTSISPIDGRYHKKTQILSSYFSEMSLMRYRLMVEVEYLIELSLEPGVREVNPFSELGQKNLRSWYKNFSLADAETIKNFEKETNHDVKSIEYFFKEKLLQTPIAKYAEFIHFGLTSEDINNLAFSLMWQNALKEVYIPTIKTLFTELQKFADQNKDVAMLALTHGQSATPTTVGKEFAVFTNRLNHQIDSLEKHKLKGKFGGATGTWSAHTIAYPEVDWLKFSRTFIHKLGLEPNLVTTQIENHDSMAESFHNLSRINVILIDLCRDVWLYISRGIFGQTKKEGEVGSSTMPHKINPIQFENAEGNLGLANSILYHLAEKLPISRMQRDLSDSTVLRNNGVALAHSLLAVENILTGVKKIELNHVLLDKELDDHWEILAEAIQTILRKVGYPKPYETLKRLTQGKKISKDDIKNFIEDLNLPEPEKQILLNLTPKSYTGLAKQLVNI